MASDATGPRIVTPPNDDHPAHEAADTTPPSPEGMAGLTVPPPLRSITPHSAQSPLPSGGSPPAGSTVSLPISNSPSPMYNSAVPGQSEEFLLPPSLPYARGNSIDSRRSSWSSDTGRFGPFASPFDDSIASGAATPVSGEHSTVGQGLQEKYNFFPGTGLLCSKEDREDDDVLHDPELKGPEEEKTGCWSKRGIWNVGFLIVLLLGALMVFVVWPALIFTKKPHTDKQHGKDRQSGDKCGGGLCLGTAPLLKNTRTSLIDPDTPDSAMYKESSTGKKFKLVFSDEFNREGRTFYPGEDPYWEAVDIHYAATVDLEWYDPDAITTKDGYLEIKFDKFKNHDLDYRSGMLQSWNKLCFKGGIIEASISLPGRGDVSGLWPGFWTMGNLGRPGYLATTEGMWPYTYHDGCDAGITANQSSTDGINYLPGMKLPGCTCDGEDHPSPGKARTAPEIDALEASVGAIDKKGTIVGTVSQSFQVAPFDIWYQPDYDQIAVYDQQFTVMNSYRGGYFQQAISGLSVLNNDWYDGKEYQTYGFEYEPGKEGYIEWNIGEMKTWKITGLATGPNGNIGHRPIPLEPMAVIINCGMSDTFAPVEEAKLEALYPAIMRVDWVRIWQDEDCEDCSVTCDPPGYETTEYIEKHSKAFYNANLTTWDKAEFDWPKNDFVHKCDAK